MFRWTRSGRRRARRARSARSAYSFCRKPLFELLEDRRMLALFTVTSNADTVNAADGLLTLREAITAANANPATFDTIDFAPALNGQTIQLSNLGQLAITSTMEIDATSLANFITIRAFDNSGAAGDGTRIFNIDDGNNAAAVFVNLRKLILTGGDVGGVGGAIRSREDLSIGNSIISGNRATTEGGAIYSSFGPLSIGYTTISQNTAQSGGGLATNGNSVFLNHDTFLLNTADVGGAIFASAGDMTITDSTIDRNKAQALGGGGGVFSTAGLTITGTTITDNESAGDGGGLKVGSTTATTITNSTISGNTASTQGGGIYAVQVNLTINTSTIDNNKATTDGGGIFSQDATQLAINTSNITNNEANFGGGVYLTDVTGVTITSTTIATNRANFGGGGLWANNGTMFGLTASTVSGNFAAATGGGINTQASSAVIINSTISGNLTNGLGGGIFAAIPNGRSMNIQYSTITKNTSNFDAVGGGPGGGIYLANGSGDVDLKNTIIAGNNDFTNTAPDIDNTSAGVHPTLTTSFTLVGNNKGSGLAAGGLIGTPAAPINPLLGPLQNNGGPTKTHSLLPGSIAVNNGNPAAVAGVGDVPSSDQRGAGFKRVADGRLDIGAFEFQQPPTRPTMELLASSDTGMFNNDNVTNKMQPAFGGFGHDGEVVYVYAQLTDALGDPSGQPFVIGTGTVGSDASDGFIGNDLGVWEVTVEPMADGKYNFFARFDDVDQDDDDTTGLSDVVAGAPEMIGGGPATAIPANGVAVSQFTIVSSPTTPIIVDLNVTVNITFPDDRDLTLTLVSPSGTSILLANHRGNPNPIFSQANFTDTVFDDSAGTFIGDAVPPFTGTFRPEEPLSVLIGEPLDGTWTLFVTNSDDSTGSIDNWSLTIVEPIMVVIDTVAPNTPSLDLLDDSGRNNADNVTRFNDPFVQMTTTDPNGQFAQLLFTDNLKFRIYDRYNSFTAAEVLIYDSAQDAFADMNMTDGDMFTALTELSVFLPNLLPASPGIINGRLADGVHNLKLVVEDRAGNLSHDFQLTITVDTATPPVSFGLPDAAITIDGLAADSDSGVTTVPATFADRITNDTTPRLWGRAEADTVVRVYFDKNGDDVIQLDGPNADIFLGQTVAVPLDGNDAYPDGYWEIVSALDLNQIVGLPKDGLRRLLVTAEDVAGNPRPTFAGDFQTITDVGKLQIFIDTQGPQITAVTVNDLTEAQYDLFDPKPSVTGPTPLVNRLKIAVRDLPNRAAADFLYAALDAGIAATVGNYLLVGDHVGTVAIQNVVATLVPAVNGQPATATIELFFATPLPDDRYTFTISDNLVDPANNKLDGESNADEPTDIPTFPSGDGVPGGSFIARFTVDSRPEIGSWVAQDIDIDINGNFVWDPANGQIGNDATNVDISWTLPVQNADGSIGLGGFNVHDLLFAGKFRPNANGENGGGIHRYFDQLAAFGNSAQDGGVFRWIIDTNSDGVVKLGTDIKTFQPLLANFNVAGAIPVAGNFDNNANNGDEIGLYNSGKWGLDFNRNFIIEAGEVISTGLFGRPIVGDFDGDGLDDLAVFNSNVFSFNLRNDGFGDANDRSLVWGFPGVLDQPVAADMDQDGIDDIGLWVPRNSASTPGALSEWYFLISNDPLGNLRTTGNINRLNHAFTPVPFGKDLYAEFGDDQAMPIVGNFDPPVAPRSTQASPLAGDYDGNNRVDQADYTLWRNNFGSWSNLAADGNGNGVVDSADYSIWRDNLGTVGAGAGSSTFAATGDAGSGQASASDSGGGSGSVAASDSGHTADLYTVESAATTIQVGSPVEPVESQTVSRAEAPSLLLIAAQSPPTSTDDALEAYGTSGLAEDDASTTELDPSALAAAWQSWDEF